MRVAAILMLFAAASPLVAQHAADMHAPPVSPQVRVTARMVVIDRDAFDRAGLAYVVLGNERVRVTAARGRATRGAGIAIGTHGVMAFLDAVRERRWTRSESTQQVLAASGAAARVASTQLTVGRHGARSQGPVLEVVPTVLEDGRVHLRVSARLEDAAAWGWGYGLDGSPAAVDTEVVARDGEESIVASSNAVESTRESGLLRWGSAEQGRDVLISVRAEVVSR